MRVLGATTPEGPFRRIDFPEDFLLMMALLYWEEGEGRPVHSGKWLMDALNMSQDRLRDVRRRRGDAQKDSLRKRIIEVKAPPRDIESLS